jgi:hypothetical protein
MRTNHFTLLLDISSMSNDFPRGYSRFDRIVLELKFKDIHRIQVVEQDLRDQNKLKEREASERRFNLTPLLSSMFYNIDGHH